MDYTQNLNLEGKTTFDGYDKLERQAKLVAIIRDGAEVSQVAGGEKVSLVLDNTPFYANSGGQVGDTGVIELNGARFEVQDCRKNGEHFLHVGVVVEGEFTAGAEVACRVDASIRLATALNHSATHLAHAALRKVLGEHVAQKGSLVDSQRLRFDFAHFDAMTAEELAAVEAMVNAQIRANTPVVTELCTMDEAKAKGAMALFGEKYGDTVRVLTMGADNFSMELCGGTHVERTGDIGLFKIVSEAGISAGVRRIEAVTGSAAVEYVQKQNALVGQLAAQLKASPDAVADKVAALMQAQKESAKEIAALNAKLAGLSVIQWLDDAVTVGDLKVLAKVAGGLDSASLPDTVDQLKNKLGKAVVLLANKEGDKTSLIVGVTKAESKQIKAGDLLKHVAGELGGKGGGRPDMARGACPASDALESVVASVPQWVQSNL